MMLNVVLHVYFTSLYLLWPSVYSHLLHIFNGNVCFLIIYFKSSLYWYILNTSPLSDMCFANVCSCSGHVSILLTVPFKEQNFLILVKSNLSVFLSCSVDLVLYFKTLPNPKSLRLSPVICSFLSFILFGCTMQFTRSHFPDQGLNLGHSSESLES